MDDPEPAAAFEPFETAIDQSVTVGSFVLDLGTARLAAAGGGVGSPATFTLTFDARNQSETLQVPLATLSDDGLLLEAGGERFYGLAHADPVPGLRTGVGTVAWAIATVAKPSDLREAVITLGHAHQNQVVVPLADPSATLSWNDIAVDADISVEGYRHTTLEADDIRVQYSGRSANQLLPAGTAWLVIEGLLVSDPTMPGVGEVWTETNIFLERPDGVSVAPRGFGEAMYPGERADLTLIFEIEAPVAGHYSFGVTARGLEPVTRMLVIP